MRTRNVLIWAALLITLAGFTAKPAHAQRPVNVYGSAYFQQSNGWYLYFNPWARVIVWDEANPKLFWIDDTNYLAAWEIQNLPSNRWYRFQAYSQASPYPSEVLRVYVGQRSASSVNYTRIADLVVRK